MYYIILTEKTINLKQNENFFKKFPQQFVNTLSEKN